jgi:5-oxoprolinase (ATP-hydrolysing) subunit A
VHIDLNVDVGEAASPLEELVELALVDLVSSVNVACGAHAGDRGAMRRLVAVAAAHKLNVGAHPGYPDPVHLGRRSLNVPPAEVRLLVRDQVTALAAIAADRGVSLTHVKPHGALYNQAAADRTLADAIAFGVRDVDPSLRLVGLSRSAMLEAAISIGLPFCGEAFVDRAYRADGSLVPRNQAGAVHSDPAVAVTQALTMLLTGFVRASDGTTRVPVQADTLCLHADTPGAVALARQLRGALADKGISVGTGPSTRRRRPVESPDAVSRNL